MHRPGRELLRALSRGAAGPGVDLAGCGIPNWISHLPDPGCPYVHHCLSLYLIGNRTWCKLGRATSWTLSSVEVLVVLLCVAVCTTVAVGSETSGRVWEQLTEVMQACVPGTAGPVRGSSDKWM